VGRDEIAKANPVIKADKLRRIWFYLRRWMNVVISLSWSGPFTWRRLNEMKCIKSILSIKKGWISLFIFLSAFALYYLCPILLELFWLNGIIHLSCFDHTFLIEHCYLAWNFYTRNARINTWQNLKGWCHLIFFFSGKHGWLWM
jgi:hypothetical protein